MIKFKKKTEAEFEFGSAVLLARMKIQRKSIKVVRQKNRPP